MYRGPCVSEAYVPKNKQNVAVCGTENIREADETSISHIR